MPGALEKYECKIQMLYPSTTIRVELSEKPIAPDQQL